jgi:hypothetical protein
MALVPIENKGYALKSYPFVTVNEKFVDGHIFRYTEYNNEAYIAIKDVATQLNLTNPTSSANKFHQRFKLKLPNSFKKFKTMTSGGLQTLLFANLKAINIFCSRTRNVEEAIIYIHKLTQFQTWFYSSRSALVFKEEQAFIEDKLKGDIKFLSSEVKFLHEDRSTLRRDVTLLAQAVKQLQTQLDANIDRHQVKEIYERVQQLAHIVSDNQNLTKPTSKIYKTIWINFNNHFKIASYRDLPASKYDDALNYLDYLLEKISQELE